MKRQICLGILASLALTHAQIQAQASCELGEPAKGMPPEFSQFAFIIGNFDINYRQMTEDGWSEPLARARWNGRYSLDGRAIMDWWYDRGGAGVNTRMFDNKARIWKTAWHYTSNMEVKELHQKVWEEDGKLHLWQVYPEVGERNVYFETYENGRWARIDQHLNEETGEWQPAVKLEAIPAECEPRH
jgi:hypothetical protein